MGGLPGAIEQLLGRGSGRLGVTLADLAVGLQTELLAFEQFAHDGVADPMPGRAQFGGQAAQAPAGPAQGQHRIATLTWADQRQQILQQRRVCRGQGFAPATNTTISIDGHR